MTKRTTLYFNFNIKCLSDIDTLVSLIKENGRFTINDYYCIYRKAQLCSQPTRMIKRLEKQVKPLLKSHTGTVVKQSSNSLITYRQKEDLKKFFAIPHKAKEFTLTQGRMTINGFSLFSKRITKVHPSWLLYVEHDFHITQEHNKKNQFHFVPFTDLSLFLNEIDRLVTEQRHSKEYLDVLEDWPNDFYRFLNIPPKIKTTNHSPNPTFSTINSSINENLPNDFLYVPLNDIIVCDGEITINFENAEFITEDIIIKDNLKKNFVTDISWDKFKEYLFKLYYTDSIEFYEQELELLYKQQLNTFILKTRTHKPKVFETYLTKEHFQEMYSVNNRCYLKCDSNGDPLWTIDEMSPMFRAMNILVKKEYTIDEQIKCEIRNARLRYEAMFKSHSSSFISPDKNILRCFDVDTIYNFFEVVDPCWLKRDLPQYSCKKSKYVILFFYEWILHYSDNEWDTSTSFKSYLVWSREHNCSSILMYPTNKEYSNYLFNINTSMCSVKFAAFMIFKYFSSGIRNKRQNITNNSFFRQMGIYPNRIYY